MSLAVAVEIVADQVVVTMILNSTDQGTESTLIAESTILDAVEDLDKLRVDAVVAIEMGMSEILNILREVTEEENILFANLTSDLDVGTVESTDDETAVEDELHVGCTRSLCTGS